MILQRTLNVKHQLAQGAGNWTNPFTSVHPALAVYWPRTATLGKLLDKLCEMFCWRRPNP